MIELSQDMYSQSFKCLGSKGVSKGFNASGACNGCTMDDNGFSSTAGEGGGGGLLVECGLSYLGVVSTSITSPTFATFGPSSIITRLPAHMEHSLPLSQMHSKSPNAKLLSVTCKTMKLKQQMATMTNANLSQHYLLSNEFIIHNDHELLKKGNIVADALSKRHVLLVMSEIKLLGFEYLKDLYVTNDNFNKACDCCVVSSNGGFFRHEGFLFKEKCSKNCW
ncbi:hypothetical protein CR513_21493, partial [Mucuna pruriens]